MSGKNLLQPQENLEIWEEVSTQYSMGKYWRDLGNWANLETLLSHMGDPNKKYVLEMGCGSGYTSLALNQRGAQCELLDISKESLRVAQRAFKDAGANPPVTHLKDALRSGLPEAIYDIVWNGGVIEHFYDTGKVKLIKEMLRLTKPGGKVIILVPNSQCWPFRIVQLWKKIRRTWKYGYEDDMSPNRLKKMCEELKETSCCLTYAFNPMVGWYWFPKVKTICQRLGMDTIKNHLRRSRMGFVSVLVIEKCM